MDQKLNEEIVECHNRTYRFQQFENKRGRFTKIVEESHGLRDRLMVAAEDRKAFLDGLAKAWGFQAPEVARR